MASVRGIRRKLKGRTVADRRREAEDVRQMEQGLKLANLLWWQRTGRYLDIWASTKGD